VAAEVVAADGAAADFTAVAADAVVEADFTAVAADAVVEAVHG
jgi:hypothetical protein